MSGRPATEAHGLYVANGVPLLSSPIAALTAAVAQILKTSGEMPAAIIIDHLRGAMTGNEDNSGDMDLACSTAWMIARMCGCCVVLIHHARKNTDGGTIVARGSSALRANLDLEATVKKDDAGYHLTVTKNRNGAEGDKFTWQIPALDAPVHDGEALRAPDQRKLSERAAEVAGRVIREIATKLRGVTTRELNDALIGAQPALFLKDDGKRDGSRLLRARTDAIAAGYIAEGKGGKWIVGEREPEPEPSPFDLSVPPAPLDDLLSASETSVGASV